MAKITVWDLWNKDPEYSEAYSYQDSDEAEAIELAETYSEEYINEDEYVDKHHPEYQYLLANRRYLISTNPKKNIGKIAFDSIGSSWAYQILDSKNEKEKYRWCTWGDIKDWRGGRENPEHKITFRAIPIKIGG